MHLNTDKEHRGGLSEAAYLCVILLVEGSAGGRRRDCLISTVWDWPLNPKTIKASQLCAEGPGSLHIHKHHLKKKKSTTGDRLAWLFPPLYGNDIHNSFFFFYYESKKALPTYSLVSYTYIGHTLLWRYICLRVLQAQTQLYMLSIYMFLIAEQHNYICQFHTKSWRQGLFQ